MYEIPGRSVSIAKIDEDYQMIDAHIDDTLRRKVQGFEFVDFGKLLPKFRSHKEEDQHLEIVNKNGFTYLSPISERENMQINSYA